MPREDSVPDCAFKSFSSLTETGPETEYVYWPRPEVRPQRAPALAHVMHERLRLVFEWERLEKESPGMYEEPLSFRELLAWHRAGHDLTQYIVLKKLVPVPAETAPNIYPIGTEASHHPSPESLSEMPKAA